MKKMLLLFVATISSIILYAQPLSWLPIFPVANDAAQTFVITVDAAKGNAGLLNYTNTGDVYVHIGAITNLSTSSSDWKYVKTTWATTDALGMQLFSNPIATTFTVAVNIKQGGAARVNLVDMHGRITGALQQSFLSKGTHQLTLTIST